MSTKKNGTIRTQRLPKDLLDNPFQIDARSSWDLLGYMVAYLEKLNYYNLDNKIDGNWKGTMGRDWRVKMKRGPKKEKKVDRKHMQSGNSSVSLDYLRNRVARRAVCAKNE